MFASCQLGLYVSVFIDQHAPQAEAGRTTLTIAKPDQTALPGEDLGGQFPAVFAGHRALHALDDCRAEASVILELFRAIVNCNPALTADELIIGAFVGILKAAPAAHIVNKHSLEVGLPRANILDQLLQCQAAFELQPALTGILIGLDDLEAAARGILRNDLCLVLGRVFLMLGRHPHILRGSN